MRILIRNKGALQKFVVLESSDRDGSLTLVIRREGASASSTSWGTKPGEQEPTELVFENPQPKSKRITIHQSGRVNYHESGQTIFIEPLTRTTRVVRIYGYRVPALEKLDLHSDPNADEDVEFDLSELSDGPVCFPIFVGPKDFTPPGKAIKFAYDVEGFSVAISVDAAPFVVPVGYENHFATLTSERGPFLDQQIAEDQAMIFYHQALTGSTGPTLYQPNGEGVIRLIFSVPMRIAPKFRVELVDPGFHVSDQDVQREGRSEKVMLKFKVRNQRTKQIVRQAIAVKSIELDAEL